LFFWGRCLPSAADAPVHCREEHQKALYNRIYRRTTFGNEDLFKTRRRRKSSAGCLVVFLVALALVVAAASF